MDERLRRLPSTVEELQDLIRRMARDHESQLYKPSVDLERERSKRIEQQNRALKYFEHLQ